MRKIRKKYKFGVNPLLNPPLAYVNLLTKRSVCNQSI